MRLTGALLALSVFSLMAASAVAAPPSASLQISHFVRSCHSWSLNGGPYHVRQSVHLSRGGSLRITNDDLMVQDLAETSGPHVRMALVRQSHMGSMRMTMPMEGKPSPYAMGHMGAQVIVTFPTAGTYRFRLIDRGDYMANIRTVGPDNMPTLTVIVG